MIKIKKLAPTVYAIVCPVRGTYRKTGATRLKAERLVREAIAAPPSDWVDDFTVLSSLRILGFECSLSPINTQGLDL